MSERVRGNVINVHALGRCGAARGWPAGLGSAGRRQQEPRQLHAGARAENDAAVRSRRAQPFVSRRRASTSQSSPPSTTTVVADPDFEAQIAAYLEADRIVGTGRRPTAAAPSVICSKTLASQAISRRLSALARKSSRVNTSRVDAVKVPGCFVRIEGAYATLALPQSSGLPISFSNIQTS